MKKIVLMCLLVVSLFGDETYKLLDKNNGKITALINGGNTGIDDRRKGFNLSYGVFK